MEKGKKKGPFTLLKTVWNRILGEHIMPNEGTHWRETVLLVSVIIGAAIALAGFSIGIGLIVLGLLL